MAHFSVLKKMVPLKLNCAQSGSLERITMKMRVIVSLSILCMMLLIAAALHSTDGPTHSTWISSRNTAGIE